MSSDSENIDADMRSALKAQAAFSGGRENCPHRVLRKKRSELPYEFHAYVCGSCAQLFEVEKHVPPPPYKPEPMGSESKIPWGLRDRQA
jgi:hypothetical protein